MSINIKKSDSNITSINNKTSKIWARATKIQTNIVSNTYFVHNGKSFTSVTINENIIGTRLGEYARTRRRGKDPRPKVSARRRF